MPSVFGVFSKEIGIDLGTQRFMLSERDCPSGTVGRPSARYRGDPAVGSEANA